MEETVLEAGAEASTACVPEAPAVVVEEEAVVEEAVAYPGVDGEERPSQPAGFHLHLQEYQPQGDTPVRRTLPPVRGPFPRPPRAPRRASPRLAYVLEAFRRGWESES